MPIAIHVPRVNNNDDEVKLVAVSIAVGAKVSKGAILAQVETDKAVVEIEAPSDGFVLAVIGSVEDTVTVGNVLIWLGATADEVVPATKDEKSTRGSASVMPTAKARALLAQHGLDAATVPASGDRLSVADVERFLAGHAGDARTPASKQPPATERAPDIDGQLVPLKSEERGMLATVTWHRDVAVPGYVEVSYDPAPWDTYADAFKQENGLLLGPLLPLMAWRLAQLAADKPKLNATIIDGKRFEYAAVNLGFTVQAGDVLYLTVLRNALSNRELEFVNALIELQRRASGHRLTASETQGATIGFSSMARWKVSRHIPILSPQTCIMVAHTMAEDGVGVLGASYDHRVINGSEVAGMLKKLSRPDVGNRSKANYQKDAK
ncbi:2-oxo acid dehydrogenase subunit E2 [Comamonadaceae bacterium G21597-S1]|nr:2-oxo acid dehydrogenase subunit E2 [Comamonadaceae bacterium G21597-S1]